MKFLFNIFFFTLFFFSVTSKDVFSHGPTRQKLKESVTINAKPEEFTTAIAIVFLLNALAVLFFPILGDFFNLSQREFGAWVALAIHDTASVVGAASIMGEEAIEVAATLKVTRTVWIIPLVIGSAWLFRNKSSGFGLPLFVVFFLFATILNSLTNPSVEISNILKLINNSNT